jgi:hypothetical protein
MKTILKITCAVLMLTAVALVRISQAQSSSDLYSGGSGGDPVQGLYPTRLNPTITVAPAGPNYVYTVNFVNTDTSPVWDFVVYTEATALTHSGIFSATVSVPITTVLPEFDARNLDPNITYLTGSYVNGATFPPASGLAVGGTGYLTFTLDSYYSSFIYAYETLASGSARSNGGYMAAYGTVSVPEPAGWSLMATGLLGTIFVRRRRVGKQKYQI